MRKRSALSSSLHEPNSKKITLRPSPTAAATVQGSNCTLHGFTKLPLPITSPIVWTSDPPPSGPTLRRCISDPINSPGTDKTKALGSQLSESCTVFVSPLSPENAKTTPSPAKAISSASATLPPISPILPQSISDPSPSGYQVKTTPPTSIKQENPNSERMKRMKDRMREMSRWWEEVLHQDDDVDSGSEDDKNCAPKDETETETESEEAVSVERSGNCLILHIKCPCGKGYQVLLSGRNCYYKLM
ncbi:Mucin-2 like [Actinidia chinensis var. chinensis]|uniref:Mucin-2 like n=1 Tax=Actinidia chinensis var. chinensis TaxID=1590841 RepID=A0A2R6QKT5_ACTCC|nr:Mucin-2 like [Actinidia chinensis var. chinensis]